MQIAARTQFLGKRGDLLAELMSQRTPGSEIYREVAERLAPEGGIEATGTVRKTIQQEKKRRQFRKRGG